MNRQNESTDKLSADWLLRGSLSRLGDRLDELLGRKPATASGLATSNLIERLKRLLDSEAKDVDGKGKVVPHDIKLKVQWDKFSNGDDDSLDRLQAELLAAAADHINDRLYYTLAPLELKVATDYFTDGVKLHATFGRYADPGNDRELNVTLTNLQIPDITADTEAVTPARVLVATINPDGSKITKQVKIPEDGRISVGRTGGNHLTIDDISVSKIHASISVDSDKEFSVADTGSTNGTFINGQRIAYGTASGFTETDKVKFGSVEVMFRLEKTTDLADIESEVKAGDKTVEISGFEFTTRDTANESRTESASSDSSKDLSSDDV
jgi:pSer/pThr/pTyr-binding forkhead associated (FHA) protein